MRISHGKFCFESFPSETTTTAIPTTTTLFTTTAPLGCQGCEEGDICYDVSSYPQCVSKVLRILSE